MPAFAPVVEEPGQHDRERNDGNRGPVASKCSTNAITRRVAVALGDDVRHVSRVPINPRGLKIRISTRSRYGSSAEILGSGTVSTSAKGVVEVTAIPRRASRSAGETSKTTSNDCTRPL